MKKLSTEMTDLIFKQIGIEYSNCAAYWSLEWALRYQSMKGVAHWMHEAASDERHHAKKFAYYLIDRGIQAPLEVTNYKPEVPYGKSPLEIFQTALALEQQTSTRIEDMVTQAEDDNDPESRDFLSWYVDEQVDSENELTKIIKKLQGAGSDYGALMMLDHKLG